MTPTETFVATSRRICEAATMPEWDAIDGTVFAQGADECGRGCFILYDRSDYKGPECNRVADAKYIAHARTALPQALDIIETQAKRIAELEQRIAEMQDDEWSKRPPTEQGEYWHWNGDHDCAALPMFVLMSGTSGGCFVSKGQLGLERAVDCDEYGGWWKKMRQPRLPRI